jgi:membrane associated rhomboid family serine protease
MSEFRFTRPNNFPPVVKNLIIINVLVFLAQITMDNQFHVTEKLMLYPVMFPQFEPYQLFTHLFAHSPSMLFHIIFNMFGLWMFGKILENVWGPKRFLLFYFACGLGAAGLHILMQYVRYEQLEDLWKAAVAAGDMATAQSYVNRLGSELGPALGASGAVMGIFIAFGYLFPNTELFLMFIPVPIKAKWLMIGLVAMDLFGGVAQVSGDNIAHFAHLGGAITGFIIVLIWNKTNRKTLY